VTEDEARDVIIQVARNSADFWLELGEDVSCEDRVTGTLHTFLTYLDGLGDGPCVDLMVIDSDDETGKKIGETRVSTMLHEYLYDGWRRKDASTSGGTS
jgi:hypothetical protein